MRLKSSSLAVVPGLEALLSWLIIKSHDPNITERIGLMLRAVNVSREARIITNSKPSTPPSTIELIEAFRRAPVDFMSTVARRRPGLRNI